MSQDFLDEYMVGLQFCSLVLLNSPDEDLLVSIAEDNLFQDFMEWGCFEQPAKNPWNDEVALEPQKAIANLLKTYGQVKSDEALQGLYLELHLDHLALFSGPAPQAPPWESVWRERDKLLFGEQTEKVAGFYAGWGVNIANHGHEPEDHLGLELAFILFLLQTFQENPEARSAHGETILEALKRFLDEHLLPWSGVCLGKASTEAKTVFYREMPTLCLTLLANLRDDLRD